MGKSKKGTMIIGFFVTILYSLLFFLLRGVIIERTADTVFIIVLTIILSMFYTIGYRNRREYKIERKQRARFIFIAVLGWVMFWGYGLTGVRKNWGLLCALIVAALLLIWQVWTTLAMLNLISFISSKIKSVYNVSISCKLAFLIIFAVMLMGSVISTCIFFPGVISPDNMEIYKCAQNLNLQECRTDIHSFALILFVKFLVLFSDNYYIITLSLAILFSLIWAFMITVLYYYGLSLIIGGLITVGFMLLPSNVYMFATTWKDMPFCISLLLLTIMTARIVFEDFQLKKIEAVLLTLGLVGTALFRSNGIIVLVVCGIMFLIVGIKEKRRKLIFTALISVAIVGIFKGPLFYIMDVDRGPEGFSSIPFIDGVWENLYVGNELDDEILEYLNGIMPIKDFKSNYVNRFSNYYVFPGLFDNITMEDSINAYLKCLRDYPITTLKARLKKTFNLWSVFPNSSYSVTYNTVSDISIYTIPYGYDWHYVSQFQPLRDRILGSMGKNKRLYLFLTRGSLSFAICVLLCYYCISKRKGRLILIIIPALTNHLVLMIACCFQDYRYSWPMYVSSIPFVCSVLIASGQNSQMVVEDCDI